MNIEEVGELIDKSFYSFDYERHILIVPEFEGWDSRLFARNNFHAFILFSAEYYLEYMFKKIVKDIVYKDTFLNNKDREAIKWFGHEINLNYFGIWRNSNIDFGIDHQGYFHIDDLNIKD